MGGGDVGGYFGAVNQMEMLQVCVAKLGEGFSRYLSIFYLIYEFCWLVPTPPGRTKSQTSGRDSSQGS